MQMKKHLVTASYVSKEMEDLHESAKEAGVTLLCEMGLDPGIGTAMSKCWDSRWDSRHACHQDELLFSYPNFGVSRLFEAGFGHMMSNN